MDAKLVEQVCDRHGAKLVSNAAQAWMGGNKIPAKQLGIEIPDLPAAMFVARVAYDLMTPTSRRKTWPGPTR